MKITLGITANYLQEKILNLMRNLNRGELENSSRVYSRDQIKNDCNSSTTCIIILATFTSQSRVSKRT